MEPKMISLTSSEGGKLVILLHNSGNDCAPKEILLRPATSFIALRLCNGKNREGIIEVSRY